MNTKSITETIICLPTLKYQGSPLKPGHIYRFIKRAGYETKMFFFSPEYFCFNRNENEVKCLFHSLHRSSEFPVKAVYEVKGNSDSIESIYRQFYPNEIEVVETDLNDKFLSRDEVDFFALIQVKAKERQANNVKYGHYKFIHFFTRDMFNEELTRRSTRNHYFSINDYFHKDLGRMWMENKYTFGIFTTETKSSKSYAPVMMCYYDNAYRTEECNPKYIEAVSSEIETLEMNGLESRDISQSKNYRFFF